MEPDRLREKSEQLEAEIAEISGEVRQRVADHEPDSELLSQEGGFQQHSREVFELRGRIEEKLNELEDHRKEISEAIGETDKQIQDTLKQLEDVTDTDAKKKLNDRLRDLYAQRSELSRLHRSTEQTMRRLNDGSREIRQLSADIISRGMAEANVTNRRVGGIRRIASVPLSAAKSIAREVNGKVNPLEKKVNKGDTADHGVESLRMANSAVKKAKNTAVAAKNTAKTVAQAPKRIYKTAETTVKVVKAAVHVTGVIISNTIAFLFNPVVLILLLVVLLIILCAALIAAAAGGTQAEETQVMGGAYIEMIGIDDISRRYPDAAEYYRIACESNKSRFHTLIDGMYYSYSDLQHSDLVYMEHTVNGTVTKYETGFAQDTYKTNLKDAWSIPVNERDAIAIAYVYLEMQENNANGTAMDIYRVSFTQEIFNKIVDAAVLWSSSTFHNQQCPDADCAHDEIPNPAYQTAVSNFQEAERRYNDWDANVVPAANNYRTLLNTYNSAPTAAQSSIQPHLDAAWARLNEAVNNWYYVFGDRYWTINADIGDNASAWLSAEVEAARGIMNTTPQTIQNPAAVCHLHHKLWSIGLYGYSSEAVMNSLGFNDQYKEWVALVEYGMDTNPDL